MSKFVVVIFQDEAGARAGSKAIDALHSEGSLSLHGMTVAHKDPEGDVVVADKFGTSMRNTAAGALAGGLVGLLGGPVGALLGASGGAWVATWRDISHLGIGADFLEVVARELKPGRAAVIAEMDEEHVSPLDERMEELGGIVVREWRTESVEARLAQEAAAVGTELTHLEEERRRADAGRRAPLDAKVTDVRARLERIRDRASGGLEELRSETDSRVETLREQAQKADPDKRSRIEQRINENRARSERRATLLEQARDSAKEALQAS